MHLSQKKSRAGGYGNSKIHPPFRNDLGLGDLELKKKIVVSEIESRRKIVESQLSWKLMKLR